VHLQVRDSDTFVLSVRNPSYVRVDERLERADDDEEELSAQNWRRLRIPEAKSAVSDELVKVSILRIYLTRVSFWGQIFVPVLHMI
jgi:hypothetical protein